jgi:hypothetical protein
MYLCAPVALMGGDRRAVSRLEGMFGSDLKQISIRYHFEFAQFFSILFKYNSFLVLAPTPIPLPANIGKPLPHREKD